MLPLFPQKITAMFSVRLCGYVVSLKLKSKIFLEFDTSCTYLEGLVLSVSFISSNADGNGVSKKSSSSSLLDSLPLACFNSFSTSSPEFSSVPMSNVEFINVVPSSAFVSKPEAGLLKAERELALGCVACGSNLRLLFSLVLSEVPSDGVPVFTGTDVDGIVLTELVTMVVASLLVLCASRNVDVLVEVTLALVTCEYGFAKVLTTELVLPDSVTVEEGVESCLEAVIMIGPKSGNLSWCNMGDWVALCRTLARRGQLVLA